jgi:hypothetical protein
LDSPTKIVSKKKGINDGELRVRRYFESGGRGVLEGNSHADLKKKETLNNIRVASVPAVTRTVYPSESGFPVLQPLCSVTYFICRFDTF